MPKQPQNKPLSETKKPKHSSPSPHIKTVENLHAKTGALSFEVASSLARIFSNLSLEGFARWSGALRLP
jgi:hypothetical protein